MTFPFDYFLIAESGGRVGVEGGGGGGGTYKFENRIENADFWQGRLRYKFKSYIQKYWTEL